MNERSASPAEAAPRRVLVWDAPVRVFHWLLVLCFAGAWLTGDSERWRLLHVTLGYTMAGLVGFRLLWGLVGTRHARFRAFVRGPAAVKRYLASLLHGRPEHHAGHNPAGALSIVALLALVLLAALSGWLTYEQIVDLEDLHELLANTMLLVVGLHVAGVVVSSRLHRENLVAAMVSGRKPGAAPGEGIRHAWRSVAALMLVAVLGFWWQQWEQAPQAALQAEARHARGPADGRQARDGDRRAERRRSHDGDDD